MRWVLKLLAAPVVLMLTLFVWLCMGLLYCSSFVFGLAGTLMGILGLGVMLTVSVPQGMIILVMAFLVSPMGLPMAAAWMLGRLVDLKYAIQNRVYG